MRKVRIAQRKDRKGWWVYWREGRKQHKKCLPDRALAEHYAKIKYQQLNSDVFLSTVPMPWDELVQEYLASFSTRQLTAASVTEARRTLEHFARIIHPGNSRYITQQNIDRFIRLRSAEPRQRTIKGDDAAQPISRNTLNKDIRNLKALLDWAQDDRRRYIDKAVEIQSVKAAKRQPKPLTSEQVKELLIAARARSECWFMRVFMLLTTGLRAGDVETIELGDIDFQRECIDTSSRKTRKRMLFRPMHKTAAPVILQYVTDLPAGQARLLAADSNTHKKWKGIRRRAGLPSLRLQDLRVTFNSMLGARDVDLTKRQRLLEHSDPRLTSNVYTGVDRELAEAVNRLPVEEWI